MKKTCNLQRFNDTQTSSLTTENTHKPQIVLPNETAVDHSLSPLFNHE